MAGKPRSAPPARHGTRARYILHLRRKEVPCDPCTRANTEYTRQRRGRLRHSSPTDLYPVIGVLANALLGTRPGLEWDGSPPYEWRREYLTEWDGGAA